MMTTVTACSTGLYLLWSSVCPLAWASPLLAQMRSTHLPSWDWCLLPHRRWLRQTRCEKKERGSSVLVIRIARFQGIVLSTRQYRRFRSIPDTAISVAWGNQIREKTHLLGDFDAAPIIRCANESSNASAEQHAVSYRACRRASVDKSDSRGLCRRSRRCRNGSGRCFGRRHRQRHVCRVYGLRHVQRILFLRDCRIRFDGR
jgi:hypothetical protein